MRCSSSCKDDSGNGDKKPATEKICDTDSGHLESNNNEESGESKESQESEDDEEEEEQEK